MFRAPLRYLSTRSKVMVLTERERLLWRLLWNGGRMMIKVFWTPRPTFYVHLTPCVWNGLHNLLYHILLLCKQDLSIVLGLFWARAWYYSGKPLRTFLHKRAPHRHNLCWISSTIEERNLFIFSVWGPWGCLIRALTLFSGVRDLSPRPVRSHHGQQAHHRRKLQVQKQRTIPRAHILLPREEGHF